MDIPLIGLGTWLLSGDECTRVVKTALDIGYRHIDTASAYDNHADVRKGIARFPREQLFLTSKITLEEIDDDNIDASIEKGCDLALKELGTDYLDLYLIHWPNQQRPMAKMVQGMDKLIQKGKVRKIGVSNFTVHHLSDLGQDISKVSANQVEFHPYLYQNELWQYCKSHAIRLIAYRPFGKGALVKEPLFAKIGERHGKSAGQVILRWIVQKGIPVIPKASSEPHLKENFEIFDFALTQEEMGELDAINRGQRFCQPDHPEFNY